MPVRTVKFYQVERDFEIRKMNLNRKTLILLYKTIYLVIRNGSNTAGA